jgi:transposase
LKKLWQRLAQLRQMRLSRDQLLIKLGQAKEEAGRMVWKLVQIIVAQADNSSSELLSYRLDKERLRIVRRREGRYLLRSNLIGIDPERLWELYIQLTQIEKAFRNLKGDLAIRPIYHQLEHRIEAHIFVAFIAYCLHVTLRRRLHKLAPGLTPRAVLEKFKTIQMIDVHLPPPMGALLSCRATLSPNKNIA